MIGLEHGLRVFDARIGTIIAAVLITSVYI